MNAIDQLMRENELLTQLVQLYQTKNEQSFDELRVKYELLQNHFQLISKSQEAEVIPEVAEVTEGILESQQIVPDSLEGQEIPESQQIVPESQEAEVAQVAEVAKEIPESQQMTEVPTVQIVQQSGCWCL